jgi:uncharacterized protein (TIGR02646 family)
LKKINKSLQPNNLTEYAQQNPQANWDDFYYTNQSYDYKKLKELIFKEQGGLCAFCENEIFKTHKQRVEHFHPKSDKTNPNHNWALDWTNVIGVCLGGSDVDKVLHPLPANLSCDAYKDHLIKQRKLPEKCEGYLFNPLNLPAFPCLFDFDKRTGELKPKDDYSGIKFEDNYYETTAELVAKTIQHLNLNCDRLNQQRLALLRQYNQEIAKARKNNDKSIFTKLAERWFQTQWLPFFTTRRILLSHHAESYLQQQAFNG